MTRSVLFKKLCASTFGMVLVALGCAGALLSGEARAQAVCAEVKIEIQQKLNIERQGFIATMKINNGLETTALTNIGVNIKFADRNGVAVRATSNPDDTSALFFIREDFLSGISGGVQGAGSVEPKTTGEARWLIIPAQGAGGTTAAGEIYAVGATLTYSEGEEVRTVEVTPEIITVRPQPLLELDYFLARDVYADDPFTEAVEPAEPFTLGVRVKNSGAGPAQSVSIESAQPKIVENSQGLLIGFQIDGSYVQDEATQNTLLINFGDIDPGRSKAGRWVMSTTLSGRFSEFGAEFTHDDALGGAVTSLLQRVTTHTLLKDVRVDLQGRDGVRDFLALDGDVARVYETDGLDTDVVDASTSATLTATGASFDLAFNAVPTAQWVKVNDPTQGQFEIGRVERSDGKVLPTENTWRSRERTESGTGWRHYLNVFDIGGTGRYRLNAANPIVPGSIASMVYLDANRNGLRDATEQGLANVVVTLDGQDVHGVPVHVLKTSDANGLVRFADLLPGTYAMVVGAVADVVDGTHVAGTAGGAVGTDRIDSIILSAGADATGYLFAKQPVAPPAVADAAISLTVSDAEIEVGQSVTAIVRVDNLGPDTAPVAVQWQLPPGFSVESATSAVGQVDVADATWHIDALAVGQQASMNLVVRALATGHGSLQVLATSAAIDPVPANNVAAVDILVQEPETDAPTVMQEINRLPRVLALVTCRNSNGIDTICTNARAGRLSGLLSRIGIEHAVVTTTMAYREALRSGRYNVHWINGGSELLIEQLLDEVRVALRRGDGVLIDGAHDARSASLDQFLGVSYAGAVQTSPGSVTTLNGVFTEGASFTPIGTSYALTSTGANPEARFASGSDAILSARKDDGRALMFAFELADSVMQGTNSGAWDGLVEDALIWLTGQGGNDQVGRDFVPLSTRIDNPTSEPVSVRVEMNLDSGVSLATAGTLLDSDASLSAPHWTLTIPEGSQRWLDVGLRVPSQSGAVGVQTKATWQHGADGEVVFDQRTTFGVSASDLRFVQTLSTLRGIALTDPQQIAQRDSVVAAVEQARVHLNDGRPVDALSVLTSAEATASALFAAHPSVPLHEIALLIEESSYRWQALNPQCGAAELAGVTVDASTFWPFATNERMEIQGGRPGNADWEWAVGTNTNSPQQRADYAAFNWVSGRTYQWALSYAGNGSAVLSVRDQGGVVFSKTFTPREAPGMRSGSAVRLSASLNNSAPDTPILVTLDRVGGAPAAAILQAGTGAQRNRSTAVYFPAMASGLAVEGSIQLVFAGSAPPDRAKLNVRVHAGDVACRPELSP
jgi:hypothetical protein